MEHRRSCILSLCDADRRGGRVQTAGPHALELHDCMEWYSEWTDAFCSLYPDTCVTFRACRRSLSGFVVRFEAGRASTEFVWYAVIGSTLAACLFILQPYWSFLRDYAGRI